MSIPAQGATLTWTNPAGGNWSTATNWRPNQVPGAIDEVVITNAGNYIVNLNVNAAIASLVVGGQTGIQTLSNASPTLTLSGSSSVGTNGVLVLAGGGIPVAVGEAGRIYRFEGTNWVLRYTAVSLATLKDVRFCGLGGTGFAVGTGGVIYRTTNCGLDWELYNNPPYAGTLNSIAFGNCGTWWIGGDDGTLLISTDGLTWQTIYTGSTARITSVVFVDGYGYYVDDNGRCVHFTYGAIPPNAPPVVSLLAPAALQTNWVCTSVMLRAQAADSDGFVTNVQFFANGLPVASVNPARYTHCDLGPVTYWALATDNRGATGIRGTVKVTYVPGPLHQIIPAGFIGTEPSRGFQLCMTGEAGRDYQVFAHTNAATPFAAWELLGLMAPTNQLFRFRDPDATNYPYRFYRAKQVPLP